MALAMAATSHLGRARNLLLMDGGLSSQPIWAIHSFEINF